MSTVTLFISENYKELQQFLKSTSFSRAILVGIGVTVPIVLGLWSGYFEVGLAICFGAFWSSPSDVSGSFRHKKIGILMSAALVMVVGFIGSYLYYETWFPLPILGILGFGIAFISVYGFRASLISFSGLLALVLSFATDLEELEVYQFALLIGVGGLWYLLLAKIWHSINPKAETEEILSETFLQTSDFLETRGKLVGPKNNRNALGSKLIKLQSELMEQHETLREILILSRKSSGRSHYKGKRLLVFIQLVEMLETAIANPVNYDKMDGLFEEHPEFVTSFQKLIFEMAHQLRMIAEAGNDAKKLPKNEKLTACFEKVQKEILAFGKMKDPEDYEGFLMLQNMLAYQEKQFKRLKRIKWLLGNPVIDSKEFIPKNVARRFLVRQDYDPKLLTRNLSFQSNIFRHSLRLAVTLMIGFTIGNLFPLQNPYWILLTIVIIMRPSYGLTKTRSKDRIIGTLIGGAIATGMVFLIQHPYVYGALGVISLVVAFSMVQKNYKASATFITLSIIFIYAIIQPDVLTVIQFRILDTLIGAGLSFIAMWLLWPAWGFTEIKMDIEKSVKANQAFLAQISDYYQQKGQVSTSYKVSRKNAFVETSNLSSAFQKIAQEPKSKLRDLDKFYELVELNHTFLSSLASLSTFIQHNKTTEASEMFKTATAKIDESLSLVIQTLKRKVQNGKHVASNHDTFFEEKLPLYRSQERKPDALENIEPVRYYQEAHLVWEQLQWLFSISNKMLKLAASLKLD